MFESEYERALASAATRSGAQEFDVALSFAGTDREYVEEVARNLVRTGIATFYDLDFKEHLWSNLTEELDRIYRHASTFVVLFVSRAYVDRPWARHERRSALARAMDERREFILLTRFDDVDVPGLPPNIGYIDLRQCPPWELADLMVRELTLLSSPHS